MGDCMTDLDISVDLSKSILPRKLYPISVTIPNNTHMPSYLDEICRWSEIYGKRTKTYKKIKKLVGELKSYSVLNGVVTYDVTDPNSSVVFNFEFENKEHALLFKLTWEQER